MAECTVCFRHCRIEDGKIAEVRFDGNACPLCLSSASIMVSALTGRTPEEARRVLTGSP